MQIILLMDFFVYITVEYVFDCVEFSVMIWVVNKSHNTCFAFD